MLHLLAASVSQNESEIESNTDTAESEVEMDMEEMGGVTECTSCSVTTQTSPVMVKIYLDKKISLLFFTLQGDCITLNVNIFKLNNHQIKAQVLTITVYVFTLYPYPR